MTLEYKEDEILKYEKGSRPLLGYLDKNGNILDFSMLIGEPGHGNWKNKVSLSFLKYVSYFNGYTLNEFESFFKRFPDEYELNNYDKDGRIVLHGSQIYGITNENLLSDLLTSLDNDIKTLSKNNKKEFTALEYDLLNFLKICYINGNFFKTLGFEIKVQKKEDLPYINRLDSDENYKEYEKVQLLSYLKRICVSYLSYDSIERARLERINPLMNNLYCRSNGYEFRENPKVLCTSCNNPNERFYNYKIMGWSVDRVPKYYFNEYTHCYEIESDFFKIYTSEKEEILAKEIDSLIKLPLEKRKQYFR